MDKPYYQRIFVIIIDSLGIGATPDAVSFNSLGADTLGHLDAHFRMRLQLPTLQSLGLGNLHPTMGMPSLLTPRAVFGKIHPCSIGISDRESQWEMMGLPTLEMPAIFVGGVPVAIVNHFQQRIKRPVIANSRMNLRAALQNYGMEQLKTSGLIIFTDSSSTVWLVAHEDTASVSSLKKYCITLRKILDEAGYKIEKVNGVLFKGQTITNFFPCALYSSPLMPPDSTILDTLRANNYTVSMIGKTAEIFGEGSKNRDENNLEWLRALDETITKDFAGLCVTDLGEFDYQYGQKRNPEGFGSELMRVDKKLSQVIKKLHSTDLIILTGNYGNDPSYPGEFHTREYVPLMVWSPRLDVSEELPIRLSLADIGATILDNFGLITKTTYGRSFLNSLV
ncbi:phosphopentomutase [Limosilactobacillus sp. STM2_1]|uniref:Phosphopentomutase n=1 Tax=Limosilactobacillus rudii TaxID=2759755 RepID=A0A7W3UN34_9LACO|nr:phosphopentomutase [Limosilactobacillus rudii]MBB1079295.1 phosphopentomutase [Limosilactobacillus rudii]MBB1098511.1 phosphopentomutase [Limosilactobacillus rudii]MCD7135520.1 phosphopentomutase [Limosilactobacillus rudii]